MRYPNISQKTESDLDRSSNKAYDLSLKKQIEIIPIKKVDIPNNVSVYERLEQCEVNAFLLRLFDALICPVVSYGSQSWLPTTVALKQIISALQETIQAPKTPSPYLPKLATDLIERLHLSFLKWTMGVSKYT